MEKELLAQGENLMRICNSCRYCEGFCAVWRAMEYRREFPAGDLNYLANLCHDCQECYYACQYAPPHEWDINPPLTFARIRTRSYEQYAWPAPLAAAFRANGLVAALVTALACVLFQFGVVIAHGMAALSTPVPGGDFYQVASHGALVTVFGLAALFSLTALAVGFVRFCRDIGENPLGLFSPSNLEVTLKETLRLDYLDDGGWGCSYPGEDSSPVRRWLHHFTFYGFLLCFASTTVAAIYDYVFGWPAPYGYGSLPVILGTLGGLGLLVGPAGLLVLKQRRNRDITDAGQSRNGHGLPGAPAARERERPAPAGAAPELGHGDAARRAPRHRHGAFPHLPLREVRSRHLPFRGDREIRARAQAQAGAGGMRK